ncbi:MAG: hypothetical protein ABSD75_23810 [Terriglobales bacterium]
MHYNTSYQDEAKRLMLHFLNVFRDAEVICVPSSSCVAMMRDHYPKMAAANGAPARATNTRVESFPTKSADQPSSSLILPDFPHRHWDSSGRQ